MSDDPRILCQRAREGDLAAASELVARFYQQIFAYFRRLCGNDHDGEDLTQKTFSKVWQSLTTYQERSTFSTWVHGIAHHVYVDWCRQRRDATIQTDEWWTSRPAQSPAPDESASDREIACELFRWVDQLDEDRKQVVHLHYYQELSISETAEALGIATSTVKYRLRGALDVLRSKAAELMPLERRNS
jgi:RNA polymerase sigma-70 factor (ECF subfamily)